MRRLAVFTFLTLDGVMQAPGMPEEDRTGGFEHGGWSVKYWDDDMRRVMGETVTVPCDLLLGRNTYDIFAAYWPHVDDSLMADKLNAAIKYVATSSPATVTWNNSRPLAGDVATEVAHLKQQDGPELLLQGSSQLLQTLLRHDLIDEFRLWVFPVVLGAGKHLFGQGARPAGLTLIDTKTSTTGVMMNTYRRSGGVKIGSFALDEPTDAEVERRRTIS